MRSGLVSKHWDTMFDTIHFEELWQISTNAHREWDFEERRTNQLQETHAPIEARLCCKHKATNIRVYGPYTQIISKVYVPSLAALLHGSNAISLNGTSELNIALDVLDQILGTIAKKTSTGRKYTRLDISLNLPRCPGWRIVTYEQQLAVLDDPELRRGFEFRDLERIIRNGNLKGARGKTRHYQGESLTFYRNQTELMFYDKTKQLVHRKGLKRAGEHAPIIRVELRLSGKDLERELGDGCLVRELNLLQAYLSLRKHALQVFGVKNGQEISLPGHPKDLYGFLALVEQENPELYDVYLGMQTPNSVGQTKRKVRDRMVEMAECPIPLNRLFPEDHPPTQSSVLNIDMKAVKAGRAQMAQGEDVSESLNSRTMPLGVEPIAMMPPEQVERINQAKVRERLRLQG
jgi:hypothetical protein